MSNNTLLNWQKLKAISASIAKFEKNCKKFAKSILEGWERVQ